GPFPRPRTPATPPPPPTPPPPTSPPPHPPPPPPSSPPRPPRRRPPAPAPPPPAGTPPAAPRPTPRTPPPATPAPSSPPPRPRPAGRVLDVGCGTGYLLERLAGRGFSGVGVDLSPRSVEHARERLRAVGADGRLRAEVGSAYDPPEGPFDLITLTDVLEHLEDPRACLRGLRARLAPDGLIVVSTPNRRSLPGARRWLAERVPGIRLSLAPVDTWQTWTDLESH